MAVALLACGGRYAHNASNDEGDDVAPAGGGSLGSSGGSVSALGGSSGGGPVAAAGMAAGGGANDACASKTIAPPPGTSPDLTPQYISGEYDVVACGEIEPCTPEASKPRSMPRRVHFSIQQDPSNLAAGTIMLSGTTEQLLEGRVLDAKFTRRSFAVEQLGPLSATCSQQFNLRLAYDFEGVGPRFMSFDFTHERTCSGNAGFECKGAIQSEFGDARPVRLDQKAP